MAKSTLKNSIGLRLAIIAFLTLLLLIPKIMITNLIDERKERMIDAQDEVSGKWGTSQVITGPVLTIPYKVKIKNKEGSETISIRYANFLPKTLNITGNVKAKQLHRGIYDIAVYEGDILLQGEFEKPDFDDLNIDEENIIWKDAVVAVTFSDMGGIKNLVKMNFSGNEYDAEPSAVYKNGYGEKLQTDILLTDLRIRKASDKKGALAIKLNQDDIFKSRKFSIPVELKGSESLRFAPVGKETMVKIESGWQNPSFNGAFLPAERNITESGFNASWKVLYLNRNFPQQWKNSQYNLESSSFGVDFKLPVEQYQKTSRTSKYAIMFIALTFMAFFVIEVLHNKAVHPIQYLLVGFALLIFYTLLLSFTEQMAFWLAYFLAALAIVLLVAFYTSYIFKSKTTATIIAGILTILYGFLFVVLQLQDFALLVGSLGLFVVLSLVMYLTRKIDWFDAGKFDINNKPNESNSQF